jgi:hypothetical protein
MKAPLVINNRGDVLIFESSEVAIRYLEATDVLNGEYVGYDSEGRLLCIGVVDANRVTVSDSEEVPTHSEELIAILRNLLDYSGAPKDWVFSASLGELVISALKYKRG